MTSRRISELIVEGLRGCPRRFALPLRGTSLCLLGENGHAKTTLADAAEFWSTGDLAAFHREGCSLASAIHLDASVAVVEIAGSGFSQRKRTLTAAEGPGALELVGPSVPEETAIGVIPILRHATIADFMGKTAGEKKKALLDMLGLGRLNGLREPLKTSCGRAKRDADATRRQLASERAAVESQLGGEDLVAYAEQRRVLVGIERPIKHVDDVLGLSLSVPPLVGPDRPAIVDRLAAALAALGDDPSVRWNGEVADEDAVRAEGSAALVQAAQSVVSTGDRECPVCEQPVVGQELAERLAERASSLEVIRVRLSEAGEELGAFETRLGAVAAVIADLRRAEPPDGWPQQAGLAAMEERLSGHLAAMRTARAERSPCPPVPDLDDLRAAVSDLRDAARSDSGVSQARALIELVELREKCLRLRDAERSSAAADRAHAAVQRILAIADEETERAITAAIRSVADLAANYYGKLVRGSPFTDLQLVYKAARSGQVEFSLTFDGRHSNVSPPHRVMSSSQLNALGIALHLARLKLEPQQWRTLILDDVVNSFSAPYRQGVARLLADEFADWQVIVLTHDRAFKEILRRTVKGWQFKEISAFSARGGPLLSDGDPRVALRDRLDEGATAMEVAHLARRALEQGLSGPLEKLAYEIRFDSQQRYGAHDYLRAFRQGLKRQGSDLKDLPVLSRMDADSYMTNLGVHDRVDATALTTDDLYRLVDDLDELDSELHCAGCGDPVWKESRHRSGGHSFHCACGKLAA